MDVAILGTSRAGKTTLFSLLSGLPYEKAVAQAVRTVDVKVPDPVLARLHEKAFPEGRCVQPKIRLRDTPPLDPAGDNTSVTGSIGAPEALILVLKAYDLPGSLNARLRAAREELESLRRALVRVDLLKVRRRIDQIEESLAKPVREREALRREREMLVRLEAALAEGRREGFEGIPPTDAKKLRAMQILSDRPMLPIANLSDSDGVVEDGPEGWSLKLEADLRELPEEERGEFMQAYGLTELRAPGWLLRSVRKLGYVFFYTVGERETAGWGVPRGTTALEAAGRIHTDMAKGFIACEVLPVSAVEEHGSFRQARLKVKPRLEGKGYVVQEGDILHFRFNP